MRQPNPYVIAVRAPDSGIKQLENNEWKIVSEPYAMESLCKQTALKLMPFVTSKCKGDIAVYEFDVATQRLQGSPRMVGRNGQAVRAELPDDLSKVNEYEESVKIELDDLVDKHSLIGEYHFGKFTRRTDLEVIARRSMTKGVVNAMANYVLETNARMMSAFAVLSVVVFGVAIIVGHGLQHGATEIKALAERKQIDDMITIANVDSRQIRALRDGAMEALRPHPKRPGWLQLIRVYPASYGVWIDVILEISETNYRATNGKYMETDAPWRTKEEIPKEPKGIHDPFKSQA